MTDQPKTSGPRIGRAKRKSITTSTRDWVDVRPLHDDRPTPILITPKFDECNLHDWLESNLDYVRKMWDEDGSVLFRGFDLGGTAGFAKFVKIFAQGDSLPYVDRSTPRKEYGKNIYCTTIYPEENTIRLHNEGSYWLVHPAVAFFGCITPPEEGGATPTGDVNLVYERIDPAIREEFERRDWMLQRNYNEGLSLPWQEVFQTKDKAEVEAYCAENKIVLEWKGDDGLRTQQIRPAVMVHPRSGAKLWHNHAAFFHMSARDDDMRAALAADYAHDELPYNTYYGDGGVIPDDVIAHILEAYDAETTRFQWQAGDLHLIDNLRMAHARDPYKGERLILVSLNEPYVPEA